MTGRDLVIRARRMVSADGEGAVAVVVHGDEIVGVEPFDAEVPGAEEVRLADDEVLLPGLVDSHVHVNDPGRAEWEGFPSATRAAVAGGVTTLVDMPLNSIPPTVDVPALEVKLAAAADRVYLDVGFWGGAVPGNLACLRPLHDAGVFGFKCFLLHSGVDEFGHLDTGQVEAAMRELATFDGLLIVHAEDHEAIAGAPACSGTDYRGFLDSRPGEAENRAVRTVVELARRTGCRVHILHVSSAGAVPIIAEARAGGVRVTAETCPHYLALVAEEIPDGATEYKCCPPIRERANRDRLWEALGEGVIDLVVSDHSPSTPDLKHLDTGDFGTAWGGISSLQLGLSVVWTEARARGFGLADVVRWMAQAPSELAGLRRKGRIAPGYDADLCVFAPEEEFVVAARNLYHRNAITPYDGRRLKGVVRRTWLRGAPVDLDAAPRGRLLVRGDD
ncbi:allantoinase AllB [Saccharomonospora xinjiangensis]|uniref:allantoinase n=1 Tax=Saccharomonospora xinjiangensis XJ-54 TaxID=882086 RepID=I0V8A0_9PSEU|nr:allantoinase AllB [Saccharomonospora xinjiangensis]EID56353.1 allantoinase [Saccharomonospora xinjiangensis XJ-54]